MQGNNETESSHYFSTSPQSHSERHRFSINGPHSDLILDGESGVFSQHGLDKGTEVLLDAMARYGFPSPPDGTALCDLGCGSGAIALTLASTFPHCIVYAIDVNERARQLCRDNAALNHLTNIVVASPEEIDATRTFSLLWSNPPIRIGKQELHQLLTTWLARLDSDGHAHLVVSKNLGADSLSRWMETLEYSVERIASSKGFRVLHVTRNEQP